jgi:hypothetical protein
MAIANNLAVLELLFTFGVTEVVFFERGKRCVLDNVRSELVSDRGGLSLVLFELVLEFFDLMFEVFCL